MGLAILAHNLEQLPGSRQSLEGPVLLHPRRPGPRATAHVTGFFSGISVVPHGGKCPGEAAAAQEHRGTEQDLDTCTGEFPHPHG